MQRTARADDARRPRLRSDPHRATGQRRNSIATCVYTRGKAGPSPRPRRPRRQARFLHSAWRDLCSKTPGPRDGEPGTWVDYLVKVSQSLVTVGSPFGQDGRTRPHAHRRTLAAMGGMPPERRSDRAPVRIRYPRAGHSAAEWRRRVIATTVESPDDEPQFVESPCRRRLVDARSSDDGLRRQGRTWNSPHEPQLA